jgi:branched-chain amino acid transport system substrate-binding protein
MRSYRRHSPWLAACLIVLVLGACGARSASVSESPETIKIGALFALSGPTSEVGIPYSIGEQAFIDWRNEQGRIAGRTLELIHNDYAYQIPKAEELYAQYINQDKVVAIAGWGTGDTEALKGKISQDKVPFISASYSAALADPRRTPYNFLVGTTYSDQLIIAQQWALENWKHKGGVGAPRFAYLISDSPFGKSPTEDGKKHAISTGVAEPLIVSAPRGASDLTPQLTQIGQSGANYVFIQNTSNPAALALKNAQALGLLNTTPNTQARGKKLPTQFICLNWCADELVVQRGGDAAEGLVGIIPFAPPTTNAPGAKRALDYARSKQLDLAGSELHFVQGWWSMAVLVKGIEQAAEGGQVVDGERIKDALESLNGYSTEEVTAPITFTPEDHAGNKTSHVYQVRGGKWIALKDPAPAPCGESGCAH